MESKTQASEKLKPVEKTTKAFCELVMKRIWASGHKDQKEFAAVAQVSPAAVGQIYRNKWPGRPRFQRETAVQRWQEGRIFTTTRICDKLGLDLEACLEACNLPKLKKPFSAVENS